MRPFSRIVLPQLLQDAMREHARTAAPAECCGILGGRVEGEFGMVRERFAVHNDLASPTEYLTNARDLLDAMKAMRVAGLEPLAIYHSHPTSDPVPSRTDVERNTWGESVLHLIIGKDAIRAWWLLADRYEEIPISRDESAERSAESPAMPRSAPPTPRRR